MLVFVSTGKIDLVHHLTPGSTNILASKTSNSKAILGLSGKGLPTEVKDLKQQALSKGKISKNDDFFKPDELLEMKNAHALFNHIANHRSYAF